jgi:hypothetical protein
MNRDVYDLIPDRSGTKFDFFSRGPKGVIWKTIQFQNVDGNIYNLSIGDWDESMEKINDLSRSNNNDRDIVFNTVGSAVLIFLNNFPEARIIVKGSTPARMRLYQMEIKTNLIEINMCVNIFGFNDGKWVPVNRNKDYEIFLVTKMNIS